MNMHIGGEASGGKMAFGQRVITDFSKSKAPSIISERSKSNKYDEMFEESDEAEPEKNFKKKPGRPAKNKGLGGMDVEKGN